ncbi:glycosyltransferase family 9 protein [Desulfovibrio litoralis]|uniref:ADP-heptose:LPS heptosyltransferase n=1 Tax=Desulfovibrio litoralis DSM 11393 TaxID=1121455 RepID=A0A1M7TI94_9BACT|nr:glycosyltransferase family 9 protein [Desulfovibrio litoralis]SHN70447.1 ADP-heptose:LPS heptosyltransferase [Desulfovibrio litoralis DSM 11393]
MQHAVIINFGRFGDLLQTQAVFNALKKNNKYQTTLVCLDNFLNTTELMQAIDNIVSFNGSHLLARLDKINVTEKESGWMLALAAIETWLNKLSESLLLKPENKPENKILLINLTPTLSARLLLHLIKLHLEKKGIESETNGFVIDEFGFGKNTAWASYLMASSKSRGQSSFNIVDVFFRSIDSLQKETYTPKTILNNRLKDPLDSDLTLNKGFLSEQLPAEIRSQAQGFVCLQLGASTEFRRWAVERFAQVGKRLWEEEHLCPIILGTKAEEFLSQEYAKYSENTPFINLCGKTNLKELALTLKNSKLLITNDTGTMHLAAGLGVEIIAIFLATAQARDTGPYIENAYSLEPDLECHPCEFGTSCQHEYKCRNSISPELVVSLALNKLKGENQPLSCNDYSREARVWKATPDNNGFLTLSSLSQHQKEKRNILWLLLSFFHRQLLDGRGQEELSLLNDKNFLISLKENKELQQELIKESQNYSALFLLLHEQGKMLLTNPLPLIKSRFLATWQRLQGSLTNSLYFSSFGNLWLEESQQNANDLTYVLNLAKNYYNIFIGITKSLEQINDQ